MSISKQLKAAAFASISAMGAFALAAGSPALADHHGKKAEQSQPNIVATAMSTGVHDTLVAAVKAAGLVETLSSPGPFTVFAPTDDAFAALAAGTVDSLLRPENKGQLTRILTYHAVAGNIDSATLANAIREAGGRRGGDGASDGADDPGHAVEVVDAARARGRTDTWTAYECSNFFSNFLPIFSKL